MTNKKMKIGGALVALSLVAFSALPHVVDVDSLRPQLESTLQSHLGREVHIGHLELSLLAGGARAEDLSIADDPAIRSGPFVRAKSLEVGISLLSIFSRSLHVTSLTIKEPELILAKSASGKWNFSSLGTDDQFVGDGEPGTPLSSVVLDRLKITDATLVLPDLGGPKPAVLKNISIDLGSSPIDGRASFVASTQSDSGKIEFHGEAGPLNRENPEQTPFHIIIHGSNFNLAQIGHDSSAGIGGILSLEASVTSDGRVLHSEGTARAAKLRLGASGAASRQPVSLRCATDYSVVRHVGSLNNCEVSVRKSIARIGGTYQLQGDSLIAHFRLAGSELPLDDVQGVLPALGIELPRNSKLHGGTISASLAFDGPLDHVVTSGTAQLANAHLSGFDLGSKLSSITAALKEDNPGSNLAIVGLSSTFRIAPHGTHISNFTTQISGIGGLSGAGDIDSADNLQFAMVAHLPKGGLFHKGLDHFGLKSVPEDIPFKVVGTTSHPIILPDLRGMARNTATNTVQQAVQIAQLQNTEKLATQVKTTAPQKAKSAEPVRNAPSAKSKGGIIHKIFHPHQKNQKDETELPKK
jgi:AsmA protein